MANENFVGGGLVQVEVRVVVNSRRFKRLIRSEELRVYDGPFGKTAYTCI